MNNSKIITLFLAVAFAISGQAQKRKTTVRKKNIPTPVVVEKAPEQSKFEEMLENTQQIIFIDSIVVDKLHFLKQYKLNDENGTLTTFEEFFHKKDQPYSTVFINQLDNKCWFADNGKLYTSDLLRQKWSEPMLLEGLGSFKHANYPYMMTDGFTFYFAATNEDGLGGLDLYVTRYDSESGKFLKAENLGLPFNSEGNDYMYVIDETNNIGFFASDRRQPDGKVCVYTFIPPKLRSIYTKEQFDENVIRSRARIDRIEDTWADGTERAKALNRLQTIVVAKDKIKNHPTFRFPIKDDVVYLSVNDFQVPANRSRITQLLEMRKLYESIGIEIDKTRRDYATKADSDEKKRLKTEIQDLEQQYDQLQKQIHQAEKQIRNSEILQIK